jgi:hypothetical protein
MNGIDIPTGDDSPKSLVIWKIIVSGILGLTAIAKFFGLLHRSNLLFQIDPVFKVPIIHVVATACFLEFAMTVGVWFVADQNKVAWMVFIFAVTALTYRGIAAASGVTHCPCLGNVADWWPWLGRNENPLLATVSIWLLFTSASQLIPRREEA